uniref:Claudin n=1 Tax=Ciona intestinalis TaxID=7719 RepID=A0A1W5BNS4_CIOIN|nr:claudin-19-like isoform X1 [Ciona intestinalis]XP_018672121.1 claudin-19-like isoform X2 [Ciona intestinalis]|eukprot:XP_002131512.1 claudin-19-like isoform X1 [Ciona intestinalis]
MSKSVLQAVGWVFSLGCCGATIGVTLSHKWKKNTVEGIHHSVLDSVSNVAGLWDFCQVFPSGQTQCWPIAATSVPALLLFCRILMIFGILLGCVAGFLTICSFKCTTLGPEARHAREKLSLYCGLMNLLSGICVVVATSSYIYETLNTPPSVDPRGQSVMNEVSEAAQISLAFSIIWCLASVVMIAGSTTTAEPKVKYHYPTKPIPMQEYV